MVAMHSQMTEIRERNASTKRAGGRANSQLGSSKSGQDTNGLLRSVMTVHEVVVSKRTNKVDVFLNRRWSVCMGRYQGRRRIRAGRVLFGDGMSEARGL